MCSFVFLLFLPGNALSQARTKKMKAGKTVIGEYDTESESRLALVIGNSSYDFSPLRNPANDATDMASTLQGLGFNVILKKNADLQSIEEALEDFGNRLRKGGTGLFYYAGHGVQIGGVNYLIPVSARIKKESDIKYVALDAGRILDEMANANNGLNIVIMDACRDNPYPAKFRSASRGLAIVSNAPIGTFISYSTGPGQVAQDGYGRNSPYTATLLEYIKLPGLTIEQVFKGVRQKLSRATGGKQIPWELSSLQGEFYFQHASDEPAISRPVGANYEDKRQLEMERQKLEEEKARIAAERRHFEETKRVTEEKRKLDEEKRMIEEKAWKVEEQRFAMAKQKLDEKNARKAAERKQLEETRKIIEEKRMLDEDRQKFKEAQRLALVKKKFEEEKQKAEEQHVAMAKRPLRPAVNEKEFKDPVTGMEFIFVQGGCFQMGDTFGDGDADEKPVHEACVKDFYMGKYEVTQWQWKILISNNPSKFQNGDNYPIEQVSWNDTQEFLKLLIAATGKFYRLPTEAEWEYAARSGGKKEKWAGTSSKDFGDYVWFSGNSESQTHPVGQKKPNSLGLYDMSGNVLEWVQDWYDEKYYRNSPGNNPKGPGKGQRRVIRGGSYKDIAKDVRASTRYMGDLWSYQDTPDRRFMTQTKPYNNYGFRLVLPIR